MQQSDITLFETRSAYDMVFHWIDKMMKTNGRWYAVIWFKWNSNWWMTIIVAEPISSEFSFRGY